MGTVKSYSSRELISMLEANGWVLKAVERSHHQYIHPKTRNKVTVPHPKKDIPVGTARNILKRAGLLE
ncbi:type II toxin-antitoxin system HicA family toxin [Alicyclobacillus acidiphilus]|uniref:type II toxin-antitoxin system HicA family toxin n=1 Tax=Alicyclobacillus acidiphilus TaxID=182455 RepID=UPI00247FF263|nr:type II toxin-antitoxin system HicA family toxin [Alicyclobacillus acidiphilus]